MRVIAGLLLSLSAGCRIEHVDPEDRSALNARGLMTRMQPEKPALPIALAGIGLSQRELQNTRVSLCAALTSGVTPRVALERALVELECAGRARGGAYIGALVMESSNAHWGAAIQVPEPYLASEAALRAQHDDAGLRYGVEAFQSIAQCPSPEPFVASDDAPLGPGPAQPPDAVGLLALPPTDEDAGVAREPEDVFAPTAHDPANQESSESDEPTEASAPVLRALLLRGPDGSYYGGFHIQGPRLPELGGSRSGPDGVRVMPGQMLHVGKHGAVLAEHPPWHDLGIAPASAALGYEAMRQQREIPHDVLVAISNDQPEPLVRFGARAHTFELGECGHKGLSLP